MVYVGALGGTDAIVVQKGGGVYVIQGVSYDDNDQVFSYDSVYELQGGRIERKFALSPFGGFKFKHADTTFTFINTLSKSKQNIYKNGTASLKEVNP